MDDSIDHIRRTHDALAEMTEHLIGEYQSVLPPGAVIRCVARTVQQLRLEGVSTALLAELTEPVARLQLEERAQALSRTRR